MSRAEYSKAFACKPSATFSTGCCAQIHKHKRLFIVAVSALLAHDGPYRAGLHIGMGLAAWRHCYWIKGSILLVTLGLITAVSTQEIHTRGLARGGILEPAHYHSDTTSASTREEDLAQHVQSDVNATSATAKPAQETPHSVINTAVQSSVVEDTTYQKDTTTKQHWGEKNASISTISGDSIIAVPQLELVVARSSEKLEWLSRVPSFWQVTVMNRGTKESRLLKVPRGRKWNVINEYGIQSDSEAFAHHIVNRFNSLAEYTVFSPARPLQLNGRFIELLQTPTKLGIVQALCGKPLGSGRVINKFATDRISTRTLNSVLTHDPTSVEIAKWFSKDYNLTWGQNLVKKYFDMIGLHNWMDERQEIGSTAPQGMLGVERSRITRHPKAVYESLFQSITVFGGNTYVVERIWLMLFAGSDFRDVLT